jgi:hypothetical protein
MVNTTYGSKSFPKNPFTCYLNHEGIKPGDFSIMARTEGANVYDAMESHMKILPRSFVLAIEERNGKGAGEAVAAAYLEYREDCRTILMKKQPVQK